MRARRILILSFLVAASLSASSPREALVVNTAWLTAHLADPNLVLLHVGDKAGYEKAHIPGARLVSMDDLSVSEHNEKGLMLEMPAADDLHRRIEALGISDDSRVVVYYGKDWISPATRIVFTLDYAGLGDRTSLLDGGMGAWKDAGGAVTADAPAPVKARLASLKIKPIVADAALVRARLGAKGTAIVDGRSPVFYDGLDTGGQHGEPHRTGHIRGAVSIPFDSITDDRLRLKPQAELAAMFARAGVQQGDTVIGYCHIGQQATAMLFAARTLGHPVMLYDGSFQDWSRRADAPVDNPAQKAGR